MSRRGPCWLEPLLGALRQTAPCRLCFFAELPWPCLRAAALDRRPVRPPLGLCFWVIAVASKRLCRYYSFKPPRLRVTLPPHTAASRRRLHLRAALVAPRDLVALPLLRRLVRFCTAGSRPVALSISRPPLHRAGLAARYAGLRACLLLLSRRTHV